ncbi:MAG: hypothetical protein EOO26_09550 [Comamonadaceae bacterium]|nr:MAG: hypothetical protein EOO26_09550 [Comamonadaceae bacterium]
MKARLFLCALLLGAAGASHAVQDCELNGQHVNTANGNTTAGKTGLIRCKDRDTGAMLREQQLQNGVFMGLVRMYQDGKLFKEHNVNAKGNMEGPAREFAPSGKVVRESVYADSNEIGLIRVFYASGARRRIAFNGEGSRETASVEFTEAGQPSALRCGEKPVLAPAFDDAKACGFVGGPSQIELFDGQPESIGELNGTQSVGRRFSSTGVKRFEVFSVVNDRRTVRQRELEYSERGTLVREQRWSPEGMPTSDDSYYLNGQPRSKSVYGGADGPQRTVEVAEFYDNGQRARQGRFKTGLRGGSTTPLGTHQSFDEKGRLAAETSYDDKGRTTRERVFDENGQLQRDDEVFEDGSRKAFAK